MNSAGKIFKFSLKVLGVIVLLAIAFAIYNHIYPLSLGIHSKVNQSLLSGVAINGYDPVAYITQLEAVKGDENISYGWNDATWQFSSQENLELFKNDPEKYAPQFGGYCVYSVSKGFSANSDPETFDVTDGKLYLCADPDVKEEFLSDKDEGLKKAEENWK